MEAVYEWIRSLVFYLILMTTVLNFLPDRKYEKYLRLFTGMVFILLVFGPLGDLTGLEERMAGAFGRITFQNDVKLLQREIADADGTRMKRLADSYRRAVETDLMTMAESAGLECRQAEAVVEEDPERPGFGSVLEVKLIVGSPEAGAGAPGRGYGGLPGTGSGNLEPGGKRPRGWAGAAQKGQPGDRKSENKDRRVLWSGRRTDPDRSGG